MSRKSVPVGTGSMFLKDEDEDWLILSAKVAWMFVPDRKKKNLSAASAPRLGQGSVRAQFRVDRHAFCPQISSTKKRPLYTMAEGLPPLPPGWTEHTAPTGHKYYYNTTTKKSTYKRPTESLQQTPPTSFLVEQPQLKNTALIIPKTKAVPVTEWTSNMSVEPTDTEERQTARLMSDDMWKKLEDRPRKKYLTLLSARLVYER